MDKAQVASMLEEIASLLALKADSNVFEQRAYENAARALNSLDGDLTQLVEQKKLKGTPGLGATLIKRVEEAVQEGHIAILNELRANTPAVKLEMMRIPGVGPKKINAMYDELHPKSIADLEQACKDDKVAKIPGFGKKTQEKILQGIAFLQQHADRFRFDVAFTEAERIRAALATLPEIVRLEVAGSLRRRRETVKDIDMVVSVSDGAGQDEREKIMTFFTSQPGILSITGKGLTKSSVVLASGIAMDLRVVSDSQFPSTLHHFTGSREHHIPLRRRAQNMGMTINDYGLFKISDGSEELIPCHEESDIYAALNLEYIAPELREDTGEIEAAAQHKLPKLVEQSDMRGILHAHSTYSDGQRTIREMVDACIERGYSYLGLSDHSKAAAYAGGLSEDDVRRQWEEIDRLNAELKGRFRILKGIECDILKDGTLDFENDLLAGFDFVIVSIHSNFNLTPEEQTRRMLRAIANPYTSIIAHPTGRLLLGRAGYTLDMEAVVDAAAREGVCIEINAHPSRLDLDWRLVRKGREKGLKVPIGPDAHTTEGLDDVFYGIGIARKGWLSAEDVPNTLEADELLRFFQEQRERRLKQSSVAH
ncbi:DNA polymerase/3'-5' exonuclease PolX [Ktedonospora formicarum]|uniref:DNA polymerase beta n=1 Tax=Ktedonospora formicarum TaxID=2778364 RepID=A0A8J3I0X3_9CHLR|nr:DNA polymerase/3'-5' exonuclease PolX [Ktedonospora formicarum]GHO44648.1 DNA polymerase/3'-5' exonuclease PolX [Ktedonospora formicarum]